MPPTRAVEPSPPRSRPQPGSGAPPLRLGPLARLEAWWWTGPLGHLVAGTLDLVPLFARYYVYLARRRVARQARSLAGRAREALRAR